MNAIAKNPYTPLAIEIAGIAGIVLATIFFDATLSHNDVSVGFFFEGLVMFGVAGIFFNDDTHPICEAVPFFFGVLGFFALVMGALFGAGVVWARPACLFGFFAVISALSLFKVKSAYPAFEEISR